MTAAVSLPRVANTDAPKLPAGMSLPAFRVVSGEYFRETRVPLWCDAEFWSLWKTSKLDFLRRGFELRQNEGAWWIQQKLLGKPGAHTLTPRSAQVLANVLQPQLELTIPEPAPLELEPLPGWIEAKLWHYQ